MGKLSIRSAIVGDFLEFVGQLPAYRSVAWCGCVDGVRVGLGGYLIAPDGTKLAFLAIENEIRAFYPIALHKAALAFLAEAKRMRVRKLVAAASPEVEAAARWLLRLGFRREDYPHGAFYVWEPEGCIGSPRFVPDLPAALEIR